MMKFEMKSSTKYALFSVGICLALLIVVMQAFQYLPDKNETERMDTMINVPGDETAEEKAEEQEDDAEADEEEGDDSEEDVTEENNENDEEFNDAQEVELKEKDSEQSTKEQ